MDFLNVVLIINSLNVGKKIFTSTNLLGEYSLIKHCIVSVKYYITHSLD